MLSFWTILTFLLFATGCHSMRIIWDNNAKFDSGEMGRFGEERMPNWFFIFPGTKWCGAGNIAENEDDLGYYNETDSCCREHDHCDDIIEGHQTKHNLTNDSFYTRLNCRCDERFYDCLQNVNTRDSSQVGHIYFTGLGTQCYREDYPVTGCSKHVYLPRKKCVHYEFDESQEKVYQWFDVPNFKSRKL